MASAVKQLLVLQLSVAETPPREVGVEPVHGAPTVQLQVMVVPPPDLTHWLTLPGAGMMWMGGELWKLICELMCSNVMSKNKTGLTLRESSTIKNCPLGGQ